MKLSRTLIPVVCASLLLGTFSSVATANPFGMWKDTSDGLWSDETRWYSDMIPSGDSAIAEFGNAEGVTVTVTLNETVTLGYLTNNTEGFNGGLNLIGTGGINLNTSAQVDTPGLTLRDANLGVTISGNRGIQVQGGGTGLVLSGNNTYTGTTRVYSGLLVVGHNNALGAAGASNKTIVAQENGESGQIAFRDGVHVQNETIQLGRAAGSDVLGTMYVVGQDATATMSGTIELGKGSGAAVPRIGSGGHAGNRLIINGDIIPVTVGGVPSGNGIQITGNGVVELRGKALYTGTTMIRLGTLMLGGGGQLHNESTLAIGISGNTATFDLNGVNQQVGRIMMGTNAGTIYSRRVVTNSNENQHATLTVSGDLESQRMVYSGNLSLVKEGSGNMIIDGLSSYTGDTFVKAGTLTLRGFVLDEGSDLHISTGALLAWDASITSGTNIISSLYYGDNMLGLGTYGALGNSAADFQVSFITGNGLIEVTVAAIPEPGTVALLLGGGAFLFLRKRRRSRALDQGTR